MEEQNQFITWDKFVLSKDALVKINLSWMYTPCYHYLNKLAMQRGNVSWDAYKWEAPMLSDKPLLCLPPRYDEHIKMSSFKSSENIQKKEGGPDSTFFGCPILISDP